MLGDVRLLIVDPDAAAVESIAATLEARCRARIRIARTIRAALAILRRGRVDLVVTELELPDGAGPSVVRALRTGSPAPVLVVTAYGSEEMAADVILSGARRYVAKRPGFLRLLEDVVDEMLGQELLGHIAGSGTHEMPRPLGPSIDSAIVAKSAEMCHVMALAARAARSRATVLIEGETGTGKEVVARAIHALGATPTAPFRVQNCTALPETLLESELFGHVRGAFTGADRDRPGLFVDARDGTVCLDEVGDAPPGLQAKLLRVLQHGEVKAIGADRAQRSRARVVAATHRRLEHEVTAGRFRSDLYYRLTVFPITIPPLRQRPDDVPPLVAHFVERFQREEGREVGIFTPEAIAALCAYQWPGNVRELEHEVQRLVLTHPPGVPVDVHALALRIRLAADEAHGEPLDTILRRVELAVLRDRIRHSTSKAAAARSLGITREALYWKLRRLGGPERDAG